MDPKDSAMSTELNSSIGRLERLDISTDDTMSQMQQRILEIDEAAKKLQDLPVSSSDQDNLKIKNQAMERLEHIKRTIKKDSVEMSAISGWKTEREKIEKELQEIVQKIEGAEETGRNNDQEFEGAMVEAKEAYKLICHAMELMEARTAHLLRYQPKEQGSQVQE